MNDQVKYENVSKQFYYSYYNKKAKFWTGVFNGGEVPPAAFVKSVARTIMLKPGDARANNLDECDLYLIGEFDDQCGVFTVADKPELLLNCSDYFGGQQ